MQLKESDEIGRESEIRAAFRKHADNCRELGSPFVGLLCELFAEKLKAKGVVAEKLLNWPEDGSAWMGAFPLRIVGALHSLVLEERSEELASVFPPNQFDQDVEALWSAVLTVMIEHADYILPRLENAPQTNEVRRAAVLLPGFLTIASLTGLPLVLSEVGASAGLNLFWDCYGYKLGEMQWGNTASTVQLAPTWTGTAPPSSSIEIRERAGCDLLPLDPKSQEDCTHLLSYIWADQIERITRTLAALDIARKKQVRVEKADVLDWLQKRLANEKVGAAHVIYHTIVWYYLSLDAQKAGETMIRAAGERATGESPLAWLRLEPDDDEPGAALLLTLWPTGEERCIARADFHGRWINWFGW